MNPLLNMITANNPMVSNFVQFVKTFNGDPQVEIDNMIKSGKITQEQYNMAYNKAKELEPMLKMAQALLK
jgi:hypothetical protein